MVVTPTAVTHAFPATPASLRRIRAFVQDEVDGAAGVELTRQAVQDLVLAVSEACVNVVRHTASTEIRLSLTPVGEGVAVEVRDTGVFRHQPPAPRREGGFGIPVMLALVDEFSIREGLPDQPGTVVRLVKRKHPGSGHTD